ncbi:hypothetical protein KAH81_08040 [bacterium]|nr:hypothetical protein [bacterium]
MEKIIAIFLLLLLAFNVEAAYVFGKAEYWDGDPAVDIDIFALLYSSPTPVFSSTDSIGNYCLTIDLLPGMSDSCFILCSSPTGFNSIPEYYLEYVGYEDTLSDLNFVLRPDSIPIFELTVWTTDSSGDAFQGVEVACCLDGDSSSLLIDSTDYGGRVVFSLTDEGDYLVTAKHGGYFSVPGVDTIFLGATHPLAETRFIMMDSIVSSPYWFVINALDSLENPVESLFVEWSSEVSPYWYPVWTDACGFASISCPSRGLYNLRAVYPHPDLNVIPESTAVILTSLEPVDTVIFRIISDTTSIGEAARPAKMAIYAYPNPFNSAVKITINAPECPMGISSSVALGIFNLSGRQVAELSDCCTVDDYHIVLKKGSTQLPSGALEFTWMPDETMTSGVYLVHARMGCKSVYKRLLYLK